MSVPVPPIAVDLVEWRDRKRHLWPLGLIVPFLPFLAWGLVALTGVETFYAFGPVLVFGLFPIIDLWQGFDQTNPPEALVKTLEADRYYRWCTYAYLPLQYAGLVLACWLWAHGGLSVGGSIGLALTVGVVAGIAINTAHELGHKRDALERWLFSAR